MEFKNFFNKTANISDLKEKKIYVIENFETKQNKEGTKDYVILTIHQLDEPKKQLKVYSHKKIDDKLQQDHDKESKLCFGYINSSFSNDFGVKVAYNKVFAEWKN